MTTALSTTARPTDLTEVSVARAASDLNGNAAVAVTELTLNLGAESISRQSAATQNWNSAALMTRPLRPAIKVAPVPEHRANPSHTLLHFVEVVKQLGGKLEPYTAPTARQRMYVFGESLLEIGHHLCHPSKIGGRLKILAASLTENPRITREVEQRKNLQETERYLQSTMGRSYFLGLSLAATSASLLGGLVQRAMHSPNAGILLATVADYAIQGAAFIAMFMYRHKEFYFDGESKANAKQRREHFYKVLGSDLGVSACIYGATFAVTSTLAHVSPAFADVAAPAAAVMNFALFSTVALGNVMVSAKFMAQSYENFLASKFRKERSQGAEQGNLG